MVKRDESDYDYYGAFSMHDDGTGAFSLGNSPFRITGRSVGVAPSRPLRAFQGPPNTQQASPNRPSRATANARSSERADAPHQQRNATLSSSSYQARHISSAATRRTLSHTTATRQSTGPMANRMQSSEFATKLTGGQRIKMIHQSNQKRLQAEHQLLLARKRAALQFRERRKAEQQENRAREIMQNRRSHNYADVVDLTQTDVEEELKHTTREEDNDLVSDDEEDEDILQAINQNRKKSRHRAQMRLKASHPEPTTHEVDYVVHEPQPPVVPACKENDREDVITLSSDDEARNPSRLKRRRPTRLQPLPVSDPAFNPPSSDAGGRRLKPWKTGKKPAAKRRRSPIRTIEEQIDADLCSIEDADKQIRAAKTNAVLQEKDPLRLRISTVPAFPKDISAKAVEGDGVVLVSDEEPSVKTVQDTPLKSGMKRVSEKKAIPPQSFYGKEKKTAGGVVGEIHIPGLKLKARDNPLPPVVVPLEVVDDEDEDVIECEPVMKHASRLSLDDFEMPDVYIKQEPLFEPDSKRAQDIRFRAMTTEELAIVSSLTNRVPKQRVLVRVEEANIALKGEDLGGLRGSRWLNDEILNSFVALINSRNKRDVRREATSKGDELDIGNTFSIDVDATRDDLYDIFCRKRPRTHVFNTFFFPRLTQKGYDYHGVRRWLKRAGLSVPMLDLILIPINLKNFHWVLAAIDLRSKHFLYLDSTYGNDTSNTIPMLKRWLFDEVKDKHGAEAADKMGINFWRVHINPRYLPRQRDGGSCGIFTLYMADYLERGLRPNFEQKHIRNLRRRTVLFLRDGYLPG